MGLLASLAATAQPTLSATGINPAVGDQITMNNCAYTSPGSAGANQTWNFSSLSSTGTSTSTGVQPSSTPYSATFPTSNVAYANGGGYVYYKCNSSSWETNGIVTPNSVVFNYSNNEDMLHYPFTFNNTYTDAFACTFVNASYVYYRRGNVTVTADAYGTVTLPSGTFTNVLRLHFVENYQDSTNIASTPFIITYQNDEYMWYLNNNHNPIVALYNLTTTSGSSTGGLFMSNVVSGVNENSLANSFSVSPSPANTLVNFHLRLDKPEDMTVSVYNTTGQLVKAPLVAEGLEGENKYTLSVADLPEGIYFATLMNKGEIVTTKKFLISR